MSSISQSHLSKSSVMLPSLLSENKSGFKLGTHYSLPVYSLCQLADREGQVAMGGGGGSSRTGIANGWALFRPFSLDASKESDWRATADAVLSIDCDPQARLVLASVGSFARLYARETGGSSSSSGLAWNSVGSPWQAEPHVDGHVQKVRVAQLNDGPDLLLLTMSTHAGLQCWSFDAGRQQVVSSAPCWTLKSPESEWKDFEVLRGDIYLVSSSTLLVYRMSGATAGPPHLMQRLSLISSGESEKSSPDWSAKCLLVGRLASYSRLFVIMNRNPLRAKRGRSASYLYMYERSAAGLYVFRKSAFIYEKAIVAAKLHPTGHLLALGSNDGSLLVYELQNKALAVACLRRCPALHSLAITALEFCSEDRSDTIRVISASPDTRILFTDLQGTELGRAGASAARAAFCFVFWTLAVLLLAILYNSYILQ